MYYGSSHHSLVAPSYLVHLLCLAAIDHDRMSDYQGSLYEHNQRSNAAISSGLPIRAAGSSEITFPLPSEVPPVKQSIIGLAKYAEPSN